MPRLPPSIEPQMNTVGQLGPAASKHDASMPSGNTPYLDEQRFAKAADGDFRYAIGTFVVLV